jgi:hypothetical protein
MKPIIIIIIAFFSSLCLLAQETIEKSIPVQNTSNIRIDFKFADQIKITTWNKNEAIVKATIRINDNEENNKFRLDLRNTPDGAELVSTVDDLDKISTHRYTTKDGEIIRDSHCVDMEIDFEVFLPSGAGIDLKTISGNVIMNGQFGAMNVYTISGFIDISLSRYAKAGIKMKTITGEFYSDLDIETEGQHGWKNHFVGGTLKSKLNGGGQTINLETISGNIYLREEK